MSRLSHLVIGPELFWLALFCIVWAIGKANVPPAYSFDKFLENLFLYLPLASLLAFGLWYLPGIETRGLLLRVWIAGLVGGHLAMSKGCEAYSEQGPGIGTAYIVGMGFLFFALIAGSVFVAIRF